MGLDRVAEVASYGVEPEVAGAAASVHKASVIRNDGDKSRFGPTDFFKNTREMTVD